MITSLIRAVGAAMVLSLAAPTFAQQYLCVADKLTGFSFDNDRWDYAQFTADDQKYVVSLAEGFNPDENFQVVKLGESHVTKCQEGFNESGYLFCEGLGSFKFNKNNGRYVYSSLFGYFNVLPDVNGITDENSDDVWVEIGKCSSV